LFSLLAIPNVLAPLNITKQSVDSYYRFYYEVKYSTYPYEGGTNVTVKMPDGTILVGKPMTGDRVDLSGLYWFRFAIPIHGRGIHNITVFAWDVNYPNGTYNSTLYNASNIIVELIDEYCYINSYGPYRNTNYYQQFMMGYWNPYQAFMNLDLMDDFYDKIPINSTINIYPTRCDAGANQPKTYYMKNVTSYFNCSTLTWETQPIIYNILDSQVFEVSTHQLIGWNATSYIKNQIFDEKNIFRVEFDGGDSGARCWGGIPRLITYYKDSICGDSYCLWDENYQNCCQDCDDCPSGLDCVNNKCVVGGMARFWLLNIFGTVFVMLLIVFIYDRFTEKEFKVDLNLPFRLVGIFILFIVILYLSTILLTAVFG